MPDFGEPVGYNSGGFAPPDYSKTLNALAQAQMARSHSQLQQLQAEMQNANLGAWRKLQDPNVANDSNKLRNLYPMPEQNTQLLGNREKAMELEGYQHYLKNGDISGLLPASRKVIAETYKTEGEAAIERANLHGRVGNALSTAAASGDDKVWQDTLDRNKSILLPEEHQQLSGLPKSHRKVAADSLIAQGMAAQEYAKPVTVAPGHGVGPASQAGGIQGQPLPSSSIVNRAIQDAAGRAGIDPRALYRLQQSESGGGLGGPDDNHGGLFQFIPGTAKSLGIKNVDDHYENADAAARYWNQNKDALSGSLGRNPTNGEIALAHNQGAAGASAIISHPNDNVVDVLTKVYGNRQKALRAIVDNGGDPRMTAGQFAQPRLARFSDIDNPQPGAPKSVMTQSFTQHNTSPSPQAPATQQQPGLSPTAPVSLKSAEEQKGIGATLPEMMKDWQKKADAAVYTKRTAEAMTRESASIPMGMGADHIMQAAQILKPIANAFNIHTLDEPVRDYETFKTNAAEFVRRATMETSNRAAYKEMEFIAGTKPQPTNAREAFKDIIGQIHGVADFDISKPRAAQAYYADHNTYEGFSEAWNRNITPSAFVMHNLIENDKKEAGRVIDKMKQSAEGRSYLNSIQKQMEWGYKYGAFETPKG